MNGLSDCLKDLAEEFDRKKNKLITFANDIEAMKGGKVNNKPYSRQTVEPMTRLRASVEELKLAKEDPDEQFIKDQLNDILGI